MFSPVHWSRETTDRINPGGTDQNSRPHTGHFFSRTQLERLRSSGTSATGTSSQRGGPWYGSQTRRGVRAVILPSGRSLGFCHISIGRYWQEDSRSSALRTRSVTTIGSRIPGHVKSPIVSEPGFHSITKGGIRFCVPAPHSGQGPPRVQVPRPEASAKRWSRGSRK